jgi:7-cyano-7-deazaguanine synthase in queuosine biosynthesis
MTLKKIHVINKEGIPLAEKKPLLLFSGGLDSTYIAYKHFIKQEQFDIVYIDGRQSRRKIEVEEAVRGEILNWLRKHTEFSCYPRQHSAASTVDWSNATSAGFRQAMAWFVCALEVVDPHVHSCVEIGYVAGDQISSNLDTLIAAWNALWPVAKISDSVVPLKFPLRYTTKTEIMNHMPKDLYELTWVCELPKGDVRTGYKPCGDCVPCDTRGMLEYSKARRKMTAEEQSQLDAWIGKTLDLRQLAKPEIVAATAKDAYSVTDSVQEIVEIAKKLSEPADEKPVTYQLDWSKVKQGGTDVANALQQLTDTALAINKLPPSEMAKLFVLDDHGDPLPVADGAVKWVDPMTSVLKRDLEERGYMDAIPSGPVNDLRKEADL